MKFSELKHGDIFECIYRGTKVTGIIAHYPESKEYKYMLQESIAGGNPPHGCDMYGFKYSYTLGDNGFKSCVSSFTEFKIVGNIFNDKAEKVIELSDISFMMFGGKNYNGINIVKSYNLGSPIMAKLSVSIEPSTGEINEKINKTALAKALDSDDIKKKILGEGLIIEYSESCEEEIKRAYETLAVKLRKISSPGKRLSATTTESITGLKIKTHVILPE